MKSRTLRVLLMSLSFLGVSVALASGEPPPWPSPPPEVEPSEGDWDRLQAGEILVRDTRLDASGGSALAQAIYHVDLESLWNTIGDCDANQRFVRGMRDCEVLEASPGQAVTRQRLKAYMLLPTLDYTFETVREPYQWIRIRLREGELKVLEGSWRFRPLPDGAIHPDLTSRLASEAAKSARHLLRMCIRALDYLPPVDVTFFDFLRAMITADYEFVRDDQYNYRLAIIEAFTKRGIGPGPNDASTEGVRSLSADALRWPTFSSDDATGARTYYENIVDDLAAYAEACVSIRDRETLFRTTLEHFAFDEESALMRLVARAHAAGTFGSAMSLKLAQKLVGMVFSGAPDLLELDEPEELESRLDQLLGFLKHGLTRSRDP